MAKTYSRLSSHEREEISYLLLKGCSQREIAAALGRAPSTISREPRRNKTETTGYRATWAHESAIARCARPMRLETEDALRAEVLDMLHVRWSPETICGRLGYLRGGRVLHFTTLYRFIWQQERRTGDRAWGRLLPRGGSRRRGRKENRSSVNNTPGRVSVHERVMNGEPGHWEGDLMYCDKEQMAGALEKNSRFLVVRPLTSKNAGETMDAIVGMLSVFQPLGMLRSFTVDNGTEFACHERMDTELQCPTFFCDRGNPGQRGAIENSFGRPRPYLPRNRKLSELPEGYLQACVAAYNSTPRKCLKWKMPVEVMLEQVLQTACKLTGSKAHI